MWDDGDSFDEQDDTHGDGAERSSRHCTMPVTYERSSDGATVASNVYVSAGSGMEQILELVRAGAATTFKMQVEHISLQFVNKQTKAYDQAWYDPVLREGSSLVDVLQSPRWRVLVLGTLFNREAPLAMRPQTYELSFLPADSAAPEADVVPILPPPPGTLPKRGASCACN